MDGESIPLEREAVLEYLDDAIVTWRNRRDDEDLPQSERDQAVFYVDAFQSVRESLFEELLPAKASPTSVCDTLYSLCYSESGGLGIWRKAWKTAVAHTLRELSARVTKKLWGSS